LSKNGETVEYAKPTAQSMPHDKTTFFGRNLAFGLVLTTIKACIRTVNKRVFV
jgi:hypothetical protein